MRNHLITLAVAVMISWLMFKTVASPKLVAEQKESVYERVLRTGTIRCGYRSWAPNVVKDPNTGELSGIVYDVTMEMAKRLSLRVEWAEELGATDFITALQNDRIDLMCYGVWPSPARARGADFVLPIYFDSMHAFVREGDRRFDQDLSTINSPNIKISVIEGSPSSNVARSDFTNATINALTEQHTGADLFLELGSGKADVIFSDLYTGKRYMANNPGVVRQVLTNTPLRVYGASMAVKHHEPAFKAMLQYTLLEMHNSGVIEKMIQKHERYPGSFYRLAKPYTAANE